jgi:hypothetical protein
MMESFQKAQADTQAQQSALLAERLKLLQQSAGPVQDSVPVENTRQPPIHGPPAGQDASVPTEGAGTLSSAVVQEESDLDQDNECRTRADDHARRRGVIKLVLRDIPHFSFEVSDSQAVSESQQAMFGYTPRTPDAVTLPIQQAIADQIKQSTLNMAHSKKVGKKPKHEAIFRKLYKVPEDQSDFWDYPTPPPQELLNAMAPNKIFSDKKTGQKILHSRLAKQSARESQLLESIRRSQTGLKMGNCLSLSLVAAIHLAGQVSKGFEKFAQQEATAPDKRELDQYEMARLSSTIHQNIKDLQDCLNESQVNSTDMLKCHTISYVKATQERRDLWVDQSDLASDQKESLKQQPIPTPPIVLPEDFPSWDFLGPNGRKRILDWQASDLQRSQIIRARNPTTYSQTPGKKQNVNRRSNQNNQSKPKPKQPQRQPQKEAYKSNSQGNSQPKQPFRGKGGGKFKGKTNNK